MKLGMHIITPDPISTAYFHKLSTSVSVYSLVVARQRHGINVTAATNTHVLYAVRV
jgi:hypothetical protein